MIALIDGDSIAYILGWTHKESQDVLGMHAAIDSFVGDIFTMTGATHYFGALASDDIRYFRYEVYKAKPYKGGRVDDPHMVFWKPVVKAYLKEKWKFIDSGVLEADDLIGLAAKNCRTEGVDFVICSPDKDLRQIQGMHYDYRTQNFVSVSYNDCLLNLFTLMIEGDKTDNIMGIPGKGEKATKEKLYPLHARNAPYTEYHSVVWDMYIRHFGLYYGYIIFNETFKTVSLCYDIEPDRDIVIHSVPEKEHPFTAMNKPEML